MTAGARFFLGLDAGGTKTHALVADGEGHVRGFGAAGPGNWESVGLEGAYLAYRAAMDEALAAAGLQAGDLSAAGYALAGLDWPSDEGRLGPVVERLGVPGPQVLVNDAYGALRAGTHAGWGVVVIAGTGTTVAGCDRQGRRFRTFGEGMAWGDFGDAGDIVLLAMRAVGFAYTGRGEPTALTGRLLELYGLQSAPELVERIHRLQVERPTAALAPLVFEVAEAGDQVAQGILRCAGRELGENAAAVARRLGLAGAPFELVLAGGVFRAESTRLVDALVEAVRAAAPAVRPLVLRTAPVAGSALLAMEAAGQRVPPTVHDRMASEVQACLQAQGAGAGS